MNREVSDLSVLMICPQFRPIIGGYERAAERLSAALALRGLKVMVVTERRDSRWPAYEESEGFQIRRLRCSYRPRLHSLTGIMSLALYLLVHGRRFLVWHVHQYGRYSTATILLSKLLRRPVVLKLTNSGSMGIGPSLSRGVMSPFIRALHKSVDACVPVSTETRDEAIAFGIPARRVHILPNLLRQVDYANVSSGEKAEARLKLGLHGGHVALFVGRMSSQKNLPALVEAWALLASKRPDDTLVLVGDGPEKDLIRSRIRDLGVTRSIRMEGEVSDPKVWYRAADVCVIPSLNEGLSNAMIEALAFGLPVVSTRVSGASILEAQQAGIVVDARSVSDLAEAINAVLVDPELRARLGQAARRTFVTYFSDEVVAPEIIGVYQALVQREAG